MLYFIRKDNSLFHFIFINLISFGWIASTPIMMDYIISISGSASFFYKLMMISTVVCLFSNFIFGKLLEKIGSRSLILIGTLFNILFWILLSISNSENQLIIAFLIEGLSFSALLLSRAPYIYDFCKSKKLHENYSKIESEAKFLMLLSMIILMSFSGFIYEFNNKIPFIINTFIAITSLILICIYRSVFIPPYIKEDDNKNIFMKVKELYRKERNIFYLATSEGLYSGITAYILFVVFYHVTILGANVIYLSILTMSLYIFRLAGVLLVKKELSEKYIILLYSLFVMFLYLIGVSSDIYIIFAIYLFTAYIREFLETHLITKVTSTTPSYFMSAVRTYSESLANISLLIVMFYLSYYLDSISSSGWIYIFSAWFALCMLFYTLSLKKYL
jgi:MFS family permease